MLELHFLDKQESLDFMDSLIKESKIAILESRFHQLMIEAKETTGKKSKSFLRKASKLLVDHPDLFKR
ncbi:MAG TPA: hypothetical protein VL401_02055 [Alphaproteobacteria bacterium]|jgi:hypothetical protein|nr:hypothetical protein [Alphaproteobacteria bacterium]